MFMSLDEKELKVVIDAMDDKKVSAGDYVIREGEAGDGVLARQRQATARLQELHGAVQPQAAAAGCAEQGAAQAPEGHQGERRGPPAEAAIHRPEEAAGLQAHDLGAGAQ